MAAAAITAISRNTNLDETIRNDTKEAQEKLKEEMRIEAEMRKKRTLPMQNEVKDFYETKHQQLFWAGLILLNFFISAVDSQMLPVHNNIKPAITVFMGFEYFFAYIFLIELIINFYGRYFKEFWKSAWNIFDFVIVGVSLLSLYMQSLPGISVLRLFRAFRVVRLFKRIKSMRKMMNSIMKSLPGMAIAFVAQLLIMGIYGIIGVSFWKDDFPEYFGNFLRANLTLLQMMTMDSWSSGIARTIIFKYVGVPAVYFITYMFISGIIMANVLIALLLDKFLKDFMEPPTMLTEESNDAEDETETVLDVKPGEKTNLEEEREMDNFYKSPPGCPGAEKRLPHLPENRVIALSTTNSTSDGTIIEGETQHFGISSDSTKTARTHRKFGSWPTVVQLGSPRIVERISSPLVIREHRLWLEQECKGHRENNETGESITIIHLGEGTKSKGKGSAELVLLENIQAPRDEDPGYVPVHQLEKWKGQVERDIIMLMQSMNALNHFLERLNCRVDALTDRLLSTCTRRPPETPVVIKLSGIAI